MTDEELATMLLKLPANQPQLRAQINALVNKLVLLQETLRPILSVAVRRFEGGWVCTVCGTWVKDLPTAPDVYPHSSTCAVPYRDELLS